MLGVVIVTYNGRHHLQNLLPSLIKQSVGSNRYEIVIVDNGSSDGTISFLEKEYPEITNVSLLDNKGFAEPNNIGINKLFENFLIKQVVLLNNDTVVSRNFLEVLISGFSAHPNASSIQTTIVSNDAKYIDSTGISVDQSFSARNFGYGEYNENQYNQEKEIFGTTGSAMLISKNALETSSLSPGVYFDSKYFAYNEDVDLALRLRLYGFTSWYVPGGEVRHVHSATGVSQSSFKSFHIHRNTILNIIKNAPDGMLWRTLGSFVIRYRVLLRNSRQKGKPAQRLAKKIGLAAMVYLVLRAWCSVVLHLPYLLVVRKNIQSRIRVPMRSFKMWLKEE